MNLTQRLKLKEKLDQKCTSGMSCSIVYLVVCMSWKRSLPGTGSLILTPWQTGGTPGPPTDALPGEEVMIYHFHTSIFLSELTFERRDSPQRKFEQTTTLWLSGKPHPDVLPGLSSSMFLHCSQTSTSFHIVWHLGSTLNLPWNQAKRKLG